MLTSIVRDGKQWEATGEFDGETMRVWLYPEHKRAIENAGYDLRWDSPSQVEVSIPVILDEHNGRRRVAEVVKMVGDEDETIKVRQK